MDRFFNLDSPVMRALSLLADVVILNLLWLVCCIPVVTAGASTTAMYTVALKLAKGQDGYVVKRFFKAFKLNFKQATVIHLVLCLFAGILAVDYWIVNKGGVLPKSMTILLMVVAVFIVAFMSWVYPVLAQFDNSTKNICKNAILMAIAHFPATVIIVAVNLIPVVIFLFYTNLFVKWMIIWILAGGSAVAYINSFVLNKCFKKHISPEDWGDEDPDADCPIG